MIVYLCLTKGGIDMLNQYAGKMIEEYFKSNHSVCESFFSKQEKMISLIAAGIPVHDRIRLLEMIMECNGKVVADILKSQEMGLKQFIGIVGGNLKNTKDEGVISNPEEQVVMQLVPAGKNVVYLPEMDLQQSTSVSKTRSYEKWLKVELSRVTGFPEEVIRSSSQFEEDLGLDSLTMIEIFSRMASAFPEEKFDWQAASRVQNFGKLLEKLNGKTPKEVNDIEEWLISRISEITGFGKEEITRDSCFEEDLGLSSIDMIEIQARLVKEFPETEYGLENISKIRTLGDLLQMIKNNGATDILPLEGFLLCIKQQLATLSGRNANTINEDLRFEEELHIDIFSLEKVLNTALDQYPQFKLAGRELFNARNLKGISQLLGNFSQKTTPSVES